MSNPLLSPSKNAELVALRSNGATSVSHWKTETPNGAALGSAIDWRAIHALIPWVAVIGAWAMWATFLLIPTLFGLHYAGLMPAANNWGYVMMGLTLCLAGMVAAKVQHGVRAIAFTATVLLLAYWF